MKKTKTRKCALTALFAAFALGVTGTGITATAWADETDQPQKNPPAEVSTEKNILPLFETTFDKGTVGKPYAVYNQEQETIWNSFDTATETTGEIVDKFDGKAYRFNAKGTGTVQFGGIKTFGAVVGESYTLTMKADFANCDFVFVEYVANDRWGGLKLYSDRIETLDANNSFAKYDKNSKELTLTVTAGANSEEAATGMGFFKLTASNAVEGACLDIDDVKITVADTLMDEDWESFSLGAFDKTVAYNKVWNEASSLSVVEWGTDNQAVKYTANNATDEYLTFGYLNRLGFVANETVYNVSFDFELCGYDKLWINYKPAEDNAADLLVENGTAAVQNWSGDKFQNAQLTVDPANSSKGTLSFRWKVYNGLGEFKLMGQTPDTDSAEHALILDNIKIDAVREPIAVQTVGGNGSFSAQTFNPRTGSDCKVFVTPDEGWHVKSVKADNESVTLNGEGAYVFANVDAAHTLSAEFEKDAIAVNVDAGEGVHYTVTENVLYGDSVTLKVTADNGYKVIAVKLNGTAIELSAEGEFTVAEAKEALNFVVLTEKISEYAMTYEATQGGGTVTCSSDKVLQGGSVEYTVTPAEGWRVKSVKFNGKNVSLDNGKYVAENVTKDGKLVVEFEKIETEQIGGNTGGNNGESEEEGGGCSGSVYTTGAVALLATGALCAVVLILKKKKGGKKGE